MVVVGGKVEAVGVAVDGIVGSLDGVGTICVVLPHFFFIISILLIIHLFVAECKDGSIDHQI